MIGDAMSRGATLSRWIVLGALLALTAALIWPAMLNSGPLIFFDTLVYLDQGRSGVDMIAGRLAAVVTAADASADGALRAAGRDAGFMRSIAYPVFLYLSSQTQLSHFGAALAQAAVVAPLVAMIAGREALADPVAATIAAAFCIALTSAPWSVSTMMPDIFAAVAILCAMIIAARLERLGLGGRLFVFGAATLAMLAHYGHPPLYLVAAGAALLSLLIQRRLSAAAVALALGPLAAALLTSVGASTAILDEQSVAPRRLPLLLARSMEDGPALWHLREHCGEYRYAVCELWDHEMPSDLGSLLWGDESIRNKATDDQMARIRQEEFLILKRAFVEYPVAQTWSFVGNAVRQTWMIGTSDISWGRVIESDDGGFQSDSAEPADVSGLAAVGAAHKAVVIAALGLIAFWLVRDGLRAGDRERALLFVAVVGLCANAAIFGGLSAPTDRYQARVIWIVPMLAALFWLARRHPPTLRSRFDG